MRDGKTDPGLSELSRATMARTAGCLRTPGPWGAGAVHDGCCLLGQPGRSDYDLQRRTRRIVCAAQRGQSGAALSARFGLPLDQRRTGIRRPRAGSARPDRHGSRHVRWHRVLQRTPADPQGECEREAIKLSLDNLLTFPWISDRVAEGRLRLTGTMFDIRSGVLARMQSNGAFAPV